MRWLAEAARVRAEAGLRRALRTRLAGEIDLAGNDYLGLSGHPAVVAATAAALREYGLGATGSRLVRGTTDVHSTVEQELASWLGFPTALVFSSGYLANIGAIRALSTPDTLIVSDAYNHASLVDGCRLASCRKVVYPHADVAAVDDALDRHSGPALVVTESVFSVDGDFAPLGDLHSACTRHGAVLLVDDAHAVGVLGPEGAGGVAAAGLSGEPDVVVTATLSKALGAAGGIVAGPELVRTQIVDTGRTFIYDTALPPAVAAGALAALDLLRKADELRTEVADRVSYVVSVLRRAGLTVSQPAGAVVSVLAVSPDQALAWAAACRERRVAVGCFRPPSTPDGTSRLRLTINAGVPRSVFEAAVDTIVAVRP